MGKRTERIQDLLGLINGLYPPGLAEEWDNVGLQVGDARAAVDKVLVALDPTLAAVQAAEAAGAQALVTHHPLLFKPLKSLTPDDTTGRIIWQAVQSGVAVISAHTNLDSAEDGLNCWLAERFELLDCVPLRNQVGGWLKLVVFVPTAHVDAVAEALFSAGAGHVGDYDQCSFRVTGDGTFRPGSGTDPYVGTAGRQERVEETRLETIVPQARLGRVLDKLFKVHPYEEVAYDLLPLLNRNTRVGLGRIGRLEQPLAVGAFAERVKQQLGCEHLSLVGNVEALCRKVAVCGGSGASLIQEAQRQGADILLTGDVKYHDARLAEDLGMGLIDAGHFATEHLAVAELKKHLSAVSGQRGWNVSFEAFAGETNPFQIL